MNPIYTSDLFKDDGAIKDIISQIQKTSVEYEKMISDIESKSKRLESSIRSISLANPSGRDKLKQYASQVYDLKKKYDRLTSGISDNQKAISSLSVAKSNLNKISKLEAQVSLTRAGTIENINAQLKLNQLRLSKLTEEQQKSTKEGYRLVTQSARMEARLKTLKKEQRDLVKIKQLENRVNDESIGLYNRLSAQYSINKIKLNDMSEAERMNSVQGRKLELQTKAIYEEMDRLQRATGKYTLNVGNYENSIISAIDKQKRLVNQLKRTEDDFNRLPSSIQKSSRAQEYHSKVVESLRSQISTLEEVTGRQVKADDNLARSQSGLFDSAKRLLGVYLSFESIRSLSSRIFRDTKAIDSLDLAYEKVIPNTQELAQTNEFLNSVSENYGLNIIDLREAYLKYNASVKDSTLSISQQQSIFDSISKSVSVLGLDTEKTNRVFTALEQIMSKGKVSSEELRQQLGDSLPGATRIMARSLGVSVAQLDEMLKKGEVLADDALPKFAKELERTYGVDGVDRIDNLAAAQGRFTTSITLAIEKLSASNVFVGFFNTMTKGVNVISDNIKVIFNLVKLITLAGVAYGSWRASILLSNNAMILSTGLTYKDITAKKLFNVATLASKNAMNALKVAITTNPIGALATVVLTAGAAFLLFNDRVSETDVLLRDLGGEVDKKLVDHRLEIEKLTRVAEDQNRSLEDRKKAIESINMISPEYLGNIDLETIGTDKSKKSIDRYISSLRERLRLQVAEDKLRELEVKRIDDTTQGLNVQLTTWQKITNGVKSFGNLQRLATLNAKTSVDNLKKSEEEYLDQRSKLEEIIFGGVRNQESNDFNVNNSVSINTVVSKNKELSESEREKLRISGLEDGFEKEYLLLQFNYKKQEELFIKNGLETNILQDKFSRERLELIDKYNRLEIRKSDDAEKERLSLLPDGTDKLKQQLDFEYEVKLRATRDKLALDAWYNREKKKIEDRDKSDLINQELEAFDQKRKLLESEFDLIKSSEKEKREFQLNAEKLRLEKILELNEKFGSDMTDLQKQIIRNQIKAITNEINSIDVSADRDIYDIMGFDLTDDQKEAYNRSFAEAKAVVVDFYNKRIERSQAALQVANNEVSSAENFLQREIENRNAGYAHSVDVAKKELVTAKENQRKAIRDQRQAQREQLAIEALQQASSLTTASAKLWSTLGLGAIPAIGLMWGSFLATKFRAYNETKSLRKDGGLDIIGGGSHQSGNDTYLGYSDSTGPVYAEKGEAHMTLSKKTTAKYKPLLPKIFDSLNSGVFEKVFVNMNNQHKQIPSVYANVVNKTDVSGIESRLDEIKKLSNNDRYIDKDGNLVEVQGNIKTTYV